MYCIQCGKELPDGSKFCQYCGAKLELAEPEGINKPPKKIIFSPTHKEKT